MNLEKHEEMIQRLNRPLDDYYLHIVVLDWGNRMRAFVKIGSKYPNEAGRLVRQYAIDKWGDGITHMIGLNLEVKYPQEDSDVPIPVFVERFG